MTNKTLHRVLAGSWIFLSCTILAACTSGASPGYTGYSWRVVAISHDGKVTPIPARLPVTLQFAAGGQFVASDGVHGYSGTYRAASDAFTTSLMAVTANGYVGSDPIILLAISAMDSLGTPATYSVGLTGDRLVVDVGSYTLTCHRAGPSG